MSDFRRLDRLEMFAAAQFLGDRPQTVLPYHGLVTGRCDAWIAGEADEPRAILVRTHFVPTEPFGFGRDAAALCEMVLSIDGWTTLNVGDALLQTMPAALSAATGRCVRQYGDLYNVFVQTGQKFVDPAVRLLTSKDHESLATAEAPVAPQNTKLVPLILNEGLCAAAVIDDRIVARAYAYAVTPMHADLSVATLPSHRNRGLVTACASLLIEKLQAHKLTPVWSTGQDNAASQRIAAKLGFVPTTARVYLSLEGRTGVT